MEEKTKKFVSQYHRQKLFIDLHKIIAANPSKRIYCHTCEKLFLIEDKTKHENHTLTEGLSDHQMSHPTEILKPLVECKREAQYLFSQKSTKDIVDFLTNFGAEQVLCIGAPRIHEYITSEMEGKMSSLLLDFDGRFVCILQTVQRLLYFIKSFNGLNFIFSAQFFWIVEFLLVQPVQPPLFL